MTKKFLPLIRVVSPTESRLHMVDRDKFVIGRSPEAEILLISNSISRKHLSVEIKDRTVYIEDLGSSNGSFLNDVKMEPGKKYPVPEKTSIRLGTSNETVSIELMERPVEFDKYHSYLPKFNHELQGVMEQMLKDAKQQADHILKEAQMQADHYVSQAQAQGSSLIQKVRIQEDSSLEVATGKASHILKDAENEARAIVDRARQLAQSESEAIRNKVRQEAEELAAKRLEQVREEVQKIHSQAVEEARDKALRQVESEAEMTKNRLREQMLDIKIKAQVEADQILQNAHKEAARVKETGVAEFEKLRNEGQKRAQTLLTDAESEAERILQHTREAADKMRQTARTDAEEILEGSKKHSAEIQSNAEKDAHEALEIARKRAQAIIENQEKETNLILSQLSSRIQEEAHKEAQRILKDAEGQIEESKSQARRDVLASQAEKTKVDEQIAFLKKEIETVEKNKASLSSEVNALEAEVTRLREENEKQSILRAKLESLEKQAKALELQKIQIAEKSAKTAEELELLKKNTYEELERVRKEEEKKLLDIANVKAKEFTHRIEKVIIRDLGRVLNLKLNSTQVSEISQRVTDELVTLFASESFKHEEKKALKVQDASPGFFKSPWVRWGAAAAAVAGAVYLAKNSQLVLQKQSEFTDNLIEQQKEDVRFKPEMTSEYRASYTDNVLYMNHYLEMKNDPKLQDQWALNLNEFFLTELKLSEEKMVRFIGIESALLKRLSTLRESVDARYLEEGISRMREAEKEESVKIIQLVQNPDNYNRLRMREKIFLSQVNMANPEKPAAAPIPAQPSSEQAPEVKLGGPPPAVNSVPTSLPAKQVAAPAPAPSPYGLVPIPSKQAQPRKPSSQKLPKKRAFPYR